MSKLTSFVKTTVTGGMLFLIPLGVTIYLLLKALGLLGKIATPLAHKLNATQIAGMSIVTLLSILFLLIICFIAGLFMHTHFAKKIKTQLEEQVLVYVPGYSYLKALSTELATDETTNWKPATIFADDNEIICFVIDESDNYCSVFLPSAPSPSSGSVCVRKKENINYLPITVLEAVKLIRQFGKGGAAVLEKSGSPFKEI